MCRSQKAVATILILFFLSPYVYFISDLFPVAVALEKVPDGYIGVYTAEDLDNVREDIDGNYILMGDIDLTDLTLAGGAFYNSGIGWIPIGTWTSPFNGIFDGNGYKIIGANISPSVSNENLFAGIFGVNSGTIRSLGCVDFNISPELNVVDGELSMYIGSISGYNMGTIEDCFVIGETNITANISVNNDTKIHSGAITGYNDSGIIRTSYLSGLYTMRDIQCHSNIGGIAGVNTNAGLISNCYNSANLSVYSTDRVNMGGIVGFASNSAVIEFCYNAGLRGQFENIGGHAYLDHLIGHIDDDSAAPSTISNCTYYGISRSDQRGENNINIVRASPEDMELPQSYIDFDFEEIWFFDGSYDYHFPQLVTNPHQAADIYNPEFDGGDGTPVNPYRIKTPEQLNNIRYYLYSAFILLEDIDLSYVEEDENGSNWEVLDYRKSSFRGYIDGNNFSIIGLQIYEPEKVGISFMPTNEGIIKNLNFKDGYIVGYMDVGSFVSWNFGQIINCTNENFLSGRTVGGIAYNNFKEIRSCTNRGDIFYENDSDLFVNIGGIAGDSNSYGAIIDNCQNTGDIIIYGEKDIMSITVGGITVFGDVHNSTNSGNIIAVIENTEQTAHAGYKYVYAAGVSARGSAKYSSNTGNIMAFADGKRKGAFAYAGGITSRHLESRNTLEYCYNTGMIYAASNHTAYASGIAAFSGTDIKNCFNAGTVISTMSSAPFSNNDYSSAGIGYNNEHYYSNADKTIENCYNIGQIFSSGKADTIGTAVNMSNCYYLNDQYDMTDITLTGTGKTKSEMMLASTYEGFDFENVWEITGDRYPVQKDVEFIYAESFILDEDEFTIESGEAYPIFAYFTPEEASNQNIYWRSEDPNIAVVDPMGNVYGIMSGNTTITAVSIDGGFVEQCTVNVIRAQNVSDIYFDEDFVMMNKGEKSKLTLNHFPYDLEADPDVIWSSSNSGVASVSEKGVITATGAGTAVITARVGFLTATCTVHVKAPLQSISLNKSSLNLNLGQTEKLNVKLNPIDATNVPAITWSSSNNDVARVSSNGTVTSVGEGTATIYARAGNSFVAKCTVTVKGMKGDINGDGKIDVTDILRLRAHILGKNKLTGNALSLADVNGDGVINVTDILLVRAHILGKSKIN